VLKTKDYCQTRNSQTRSCRGKIDEKCMCTCKILLTVTLQQQSGMISSPTSHNYKTVMQTSQQKQRYSGTRIIQTPRHPGVHIRQAFPGNFADNILSVLRLKKTFLRGNSF